MDLDADPLTLPRYAAALQVLHAIRSAWDPALAALFRTAPGPQAAWLAQDLAALGVTALPAAPMPVLNEAEAWGMRYVLEGSALGGRVILRRLGALGLSETSGARYFAGAGAETGPRWKAFLTGLGQAATAEAAPHIIDGALRSFEALTRSALANRERLSSLP